RAERSRKPSVSRRNESRLPTSGAPRGPGGKTVESTATMDAHYLLEWCRARSGAMAGHLRELVEIESPSTDPTAVAALAARLGRALEAVGLAVEQVPVPGGGPILPAHATHAWRGHGGRAPTAPPKPVMLLGHLDTVWPLGTLRARPVRVDGDRLHG